jgi:hypothetical protein
MCPTMAQEELSLLWEEEIKIDTSAMVNFFYYDSLSVGQL